MSREAIKKLILERKDSILSRKGLEAIKRLYCKEYKLDSISNSEVLSAYQNLIAESKMERSLDLEKILRKRSIRTMSGIAPVAVLTKSYPCPGTCAYCPREKDVPVSYLSNEPAVMRAIRCDYNPYKQVVWRLQALENNGHEPSKMEVIVIGGTWSYLPKKYKYWYILNCFRAANDYKSLKNKNKNNLDKNIPLVDITSPYKHNLSFKDLQLLLKKEQKKNETAAYKIIGLTLETRPDYINVAELEEMRELACTRIEVGVQAIDDKILKLNKRGHGVLEIVKASELMKRYGFKVTYHFMPALPGSSPAKDLAMFKEFFTDSRFQPDQIKFYPTVVVEGSLLYDWYKDGNYKPYTDKQLENLIIKCKEFVPEYVRIIRLIRDIPGESIVAGNKITNLRQVIQDKGVLCRCIRCREVKEKKMADWHIKTTKYKASLGVEHFISAESLDGKTLYGFCRLRIDKSSPIAPAIIRELHVYGNLVSVGKKSGEVQHLGIGKKLMAIAEKIAKDEGLEKIAVISGVGVRDYYRKQGYRLRNTYLEKNI